jgi:hypothetical protein
MDEFEFLDAQFHRLSEARGLRYHDEQKNEELVRRRGGWHSPFETAELMIAGAIRDYLKVRHNVK